MKKNDYDLSKFPDIVKQMLELEQRVKQTINRFVNETQIDFTDLAQRIEKSTALNIIAMETNLKEGWGILMGYTPGEYIAAIDMSSTGREEYFVSLIESDNLFRTEYDDLKEFMGADWSETLEEAYYFIEKEMYRPLIPLFITILEKSMNRVINGDKNFFGKDLKVNFEKKVLALREDDLLKPLSIQMVPVLVKHVFVNNIKSYSENPIFNRNLIQHGNDIPDRWTKGDFYKIFTLICGLSYISRELNED